MKKTASIVIVLLLCLCAFWDWRHYSGRSTGSDMRPAPAVKNMAVMSAPAPIPVSPMKAEKPLPAPPPVKPAKIKVAKPAPILPPAPPPKVELHQELIPKDIKIVRCYYAQEVVAPGTTFGFDVNGSGFNQEFEKMIAVDPGAADLKISNLKLITANQIHGEITVGPGAATGFVTPKVLIQGLPVFSAPEPFGVVRPGEVLTIIFLEMDRSGRAGKFRVVTNFTDAMAKDFRMEPSTPGILISDLQPQLPFIIDGVLRIGEVPQGEYDITMFVGQRQVLQRKGLVKVVRPNLGRSGLAQKVTATDSFRRPGDAVQFYMHGTGYSPEDIKGLSAKVEPLDMGAATFTFISPSQIQLAFNIPKTAPVGPYSVKIFGPNNILIREEKDVFEVVPPEWVAGIQVSPPIRPGGKSTLKIIGRDFTKEYVKKLQIATDEDGLHFGGITLVDANTLSAEITAAPTVAPGDYWLHLSQAGQTIKPPFGSLIKIVP